MSLQAKDKEGLIMGIMASLKAAFGTDTEMITQGGKRVGDSIDEARRAVRRMEEEAVLLSADLEKSIPSSEHIEEVLEEIVKDL